MFTALFVSFSFVLSHIRILCLCFSFCRCNVSRLAAVSVEFQPCRVCYNYVDDVSFSACLLLLRCDDLFLYSSGCRLMLE